MSTALVAGVALVNTATAAPVNLVANGDFDSGTIGWYAGPGAAELNQVSEQGHHFARVRNAERTARTTVLNDKQNSVQATVKGKTYTATALVKTQNPSVNVNLRLLEWGGSVIDSSVASETLSDKSWHKLSVSYTAQQSGDSIDFNVFASGLAAGSSFDVDRLTLTGAGVASGAGPTTPKPTTPATPVPAAPTTPVEPTPTAPAPTTPAPTTPAPTTPAPTTPAPTTPATPVPVSGNELLHTCYPSAFCDSTGKPVVLNGFNIRNVGITSSMGSATQMNNIKAAGFNAVRLVVSWDHVERTKGTYDAGALAMIDTAIANAKQAGVYVILDPIHLTSQGTATPSWATGTDSVDKVQNNAVPYLQFMAARYGNEKQVVAIDMVNEPWQKDANDDARVIGMYNTLIPAVRSVDADKILVFEPMYGGSWFSAETIGLLQDKSNLVFSPHSYFAGCLDANGTNQCTNDANHDGFSDTNTGVVGMKTFDGQSGYPTPDRAAIDAHIKAWVDAAGANQIPVYVGEYGVNDQAVNAAQLRKDYAAVMNKYGLSRTSWEYYWGNFSAAESQQGPLKSWVSDLK